MLSVSAPYGAARAQENRGGLAVLVGSSAVLGRPSQETLTQMVGEVEAPFDQRGPQVIEPSPATTPSCPYCGGNGGGLHMTWREERCLYVCGLCREYAALTFDRQAGPASTEMTSPRQIRVGPSADRDCVGSIFPAAADNA